MSTTSSEPPHFRSEIDVVSSEPDQVDANLQAAQDAIYRFLLDVVKQWTPKEALLEFKRLFFYQVNSVSTDAIHAIYEIAFSNNEAEFRNTLKRCCYILVNNWDAARQYEPIQELIDSFQSFTVETQSVTLIVKRLRSWIENFRDSEDYQELKLFTARYETRANASWVNRYTSYLLVPQYVNSANSIEQRQLARALSAQLKDRFKFDLAMYVARSQSATSPERLPKNPTVLGDNVLHLIKTIVTKRGQYSYVNLANIFLSQIEDLTYKEFKSSLRKYLIFSIHPNSEFAALLQTKLSKKLEKLYRDYDDEKISDSLLLRTCNRVIEYLTTENKKDPSSLFILLLSQGNPMTLVIVLLKLILICKASRSHLEARIAEVIRYYEDYPEEDCWWVVNFLEIFNVTFAIHAEDVQYNLIQMQQDREQLSQPKLNLEHYRVFSQVKPGINSTENS